MAFQPVMRRNGVTASVISKNRSVQSHLDLTYLFLLGTHCFLEGDRFIREDHSFVLSSGLEELAYRFRKDIRPFLSLLKGRHRDPSLGVQFDDQFNR